MIETSIVSFLIAFSRSSGLTYPSLSTGKYVISNPCVCSHLQLFSTQSCSIFVVMICFPLSLFANAIPFIAKLFDSVPPDVKIISSSFAPIDFAIVVLDSSTACLAHTPIMCSDDAFPYFSVKYGVISLITSVSIIVVAPLSRYIIIFSPSSCIRCSSILLHVLLQGLVVVRLFLCSGNIFFVFLVFLRLRNGILPVFSGYDLHCFVLLPVSRISLLHPSVLLAIVPVSLALSLILLFQRKYCMNDISYEL